MESLEQVLGKVNVLSRDLRAMVVVQEEEWEDVDVEEGSGTPEYIVVNDEIGRHVYGPFASDNNKIIGSGRRITKPRITKPDTEKREIARTELQRVYDSSPWFTSRYEAGRKLGIKEATLNTQIESWIPELKQRVNALEKISYLARFESDSIGDVVSVFETFEYPDREKRQQALKDIGELYKISKSQKLKQVLESCYLNNLPDIRFLAGEYLGYSFLKRAYDSLSWRYPTRPDSTNSRDNFELNTFDVLKTDIFGLVTIPIYLSFKFGVATVKDVCRAIKNRL